MDENPVHAKLYHVESASQTIARGTEAIGPPRCEVHKFLMITRVRGKQAHGMRVHDRPEHDKRGRGTQERGNWPRKSLSFQLI